MNNLNECISDAKFKLLYKMDSQLDVKGVFATKPQDVSAFHLIVWLFAVTFPLDKQQIRRTKSMYGNSNETIDPVTPSILGFEKIMQYIKDKNQRCVVKVVADQKLSKKILLSAKKDEKIIQIYLFSPRGTIGPSFLPKEMRTYSNIVNRQATKSQAFMEEQPDLKITQSQILPQKIKVAGVIRDFDSIIKIAEKEVESFTKSFRTFENSHCLIDQFDKINRYRFRLISFINIKVSDFSQSLEDFKKFVFRVLPFLNGHLNGMGKNSLAGYRICESLQNYETAAQSLNNLEQQSNQIDKAILEECKEHIYHRIVSFYQEEGLFYHLINSNLKVVGQQDANWKDLSLPFSHLYRSIKYLYKQGLKENPSFYTQPFVVYRGGRARKSELNRYREHAGNIFIQFFGFLSTSLSAKIVADRFVSFRNSKDSQGDSTDQSVIFRIEVNPNTRILEERYNFLLNGFFRMTSKQTHGQKEQQILFNALNVFKLKSVKQEPIINFFSESEKKVIQKNKEDMRNYSHFKYSEQYKKLESYECKITVVDLEFGSFYDVLLTQNKYDLSKHELAAKENYISCMNKIRKYDKFDFGDACELTNELHETYAYLKSKVGSMQTALFDSSKTDGKNYFQRLSAVCRKLGKVKEALGYSKIAIECYRQLQSVHLNEVFNSHYEKLFDMQLRSIEILRESSNFSAAEKQLKEQLLELRSKNFKEPKVKLRESQIYINQAINYYSMGKLEESINRFDKCGHQLKKTIQTFSFEDEELPCSPGDYIVQIFCKHPQMPQRAFLYSTYVANMKKLLRLKKEQELVQKHGKKEELQQTFKLASDLLKIANQAIKNRKSIFKSRKKYSEFIAKFSQQFSLSELQEKSPHFNNQKEEVQEQIKQNILKLSSLEQESAQYSQVLQKFNNLIEQCSDIERSSLTDDCTESSVWDFIKKFKQKEIERKIKKLEQRKASILTENKHQLVQNYLNCATEIENVISELKSEGYVESSLSILKMRMEKSRIYRQCDEREQAMRQIEEIIKCGMIEGEDRFNELAYAYSTKGKIYLEMMQTQLAINSFNEALVCYPKTIENQQEQENLEVSAFTQSQFQLDKSDANSKVNQLRHNNSYLETRIMRIKALLMWIELKKTRENLVTKNKFKDPHISPNWQLWHSDDHILSVQSQISELRRILESRDELEDMEELKSDLLEVEYQYFLNCQQSEENLRNAFESFEECLILRNHQLGEKNLKNAQMCCEFISRFHKRKDLICRFLGLKYIEYLKNAQADFRNCTFQWKIERAFYFIQCARESNQSVLARTHLQRAIKLLQEEIANKHQYFLEQQLNNLKWMLTEKNVVDDNLNEMEDLQLTMDSLMIKRLRSRRGTNYSACRSRVDSMSTSTHYESNRSSLMNRIKIKPFQNPETQPSQTFSRPLQQFWRRIDSYKRKKTFIDEQ